MKRFKLNFCLFALMALVFASCSKEEEAVPKNGETASLSFGAIVNDLVEQANSKQSLDDLPECSDLTPDYVEIVLTTEEGMEVVGEEGNPYRIELVDGQVFTEDDPELELLPDDYLLTYFAVFSDESSNPIWLAPVSGSPMAEFLDVTLPIGIDLNAGVKKYVEVPVLCYDNRDVIAYGYQFFEFTPGEIIEFCIFGNYCVPNGRHFPAEFSVDVWMWNDGQIGEPIHTDISNNVELNEDGDFAGTTVCVTLPDLEGTDQYYFEITLLDSDAYGNVENDVIRTGVLSDVEVREFFNGMDQLDYYHFTEGEGCENEDTPPIFDDPDDDAQVYKACLTELNNSGALALAYFRLEGNMLHATVLGTGFEPNKVHPQHIHGIEGEDATCPPDSAADDDPEGNDNIISIGEGLTFYGPVILSLNKADGTFPTADSNGDYIYKRTFTLGSETTPTTVADLQPLEDRVVVAHGMTVDGTYVPTVPVGCAEVMEQE